nr:MAG: hypothetical protein EDM05_05960 [Leptolyngbya sp. IPPAS B-1204]
MQLQCQLAIQEFFVALPQPDHSETLSSESIAASAISHNDLNMRNGIALLINPEEALDKHSANPRVA